MKFKKLMLCGVLALSALVPAASWANGPARGWGGDIRQFERHDAGRWRGGNWHHVSHGGRLGWWWVAGGAWYLYPGPVYPYPNPYLPPVVVVERSPAAVVVQQVAPVAPPPAPAVWYFCEAANGYYPYVPACPTGWKTVPATPAPPPQ
jgi:hypothetical protein